MLELIPVYMFCAVFVALLAGYPVALTLAGVALLFAFGGIALGVFPGGDLGFLPNRLFGIMANQTMLAVPLFIFMGVIPNSRFGTKAWIELAGHLLFLLPVSAAVFFYSLGYVASAWRVLEGSPEVGGIPAVFLLKTLLPAMATLLVLQGIAESARHIVFLKNGNEPC